MTKKIVIWGYPPDTHTHSYIHLGFAKAFAYLDYDVVWCDDDPDYADDVKDSIVLTEKNCINIFQLIVHRNISFIILQMILKNMKVITFTIFLFIMKDMIGV